MGTVNTLSKISLLERLYCLAVILLFYTDTLSGPIKFAAINIGIPQLSTLPLAFAFILLITILFHRITNLSIHKNELYFLSIFVFYFLYTKISGIGNEQLITGIFIFFSFFIGTFSPNKIWNYLDKHAFPLWAIAVCGIILNFFIEFPWKELSYEVLGQERNVYQNWSAFYVDRLAGFARNNFAAAIQITFFGIYLLFQKRNFYLKLVIAVLSFTALWLTTAKMALLIILILSLVSLFFYNQYTRQILLKTLLYTSTVIVVSLPIFFSDPFYRSFGSGEFYSFLTIDTLGERLYLTWPMAFRLLEPGWIEFLFGRGFGGIGSPQNFGAMEDYNPGDNLFVVLYVTLGFFAFAIIGLIIRGIYKVFNEYYSIAIAIGVSIFIFGITNGLIESITASYFIGLLFGIGLRSFNNQKLI